MFFRKTIYPHILSRIIDVLFPSRCVGCNKESRVICRVCFKKVEKRPQAYRGNFSLFEYDNNVVRKALWELKYKGRKEVALIFAPEIRRRLDSMFSNKEILLIPIPLSRKRRWSRGFNQAEILARAIAEARQPELSLSTALYRTKHNNPQTLIKNKRLRLQNMVGVFEVRNPKEITGKRIIVIDDITTTGATLHEATKVLKKAGAKEAIGFAVAH